MPWDPRMAPRPGSRGVTLVELLIASAIISIAVLAGVGSFRFITQAIQRSRAKTIANNIVQEKMEVLKNYSYFQLLVTTATITNTDYSPSLVYDNAAYPPETITLWGLPPFTRATRVDYAQLTGTTLSTISYNNNDTGLKLLTTYVLWKEGTTFKKVEIKNLFANPAAASLDSGFQGDILIGGSLTALQGAVIQVIGSPQWKGTSDATGRYSFEVAKGTYSLICSSAGFFTSTAQGLVASRGFSTEQDFNLVRMGSGTIIGQVWIASHPVISVVVASSGTQGGTEVEFVELYNPTTFAWLMDSSNLDLQYREKNSGAAAASIGLTFNTASLPARSFYLIASTTPLSVAGSTRSADAVYSAAETLRDIILDGKDGGLGIRKASGNPWWDRVAWEKGVGPEPPADFTEKTAIPTGSNGLADDEVLIRLTSTGSITSNLGNAYDTDKSSVNFLAFTPVPTTPRNSSVTLLPVSATPAPGALAFASDPLSPPVQAVTKYADSYSEYAEFTLVGVATGTYTLSLISGKYLLDVATITITQGSTVRAPNATTVPTWNATGYNDSILTSTTSGGFLQGYVYGASNNPLGSILMEINGALTRTASNGYYLLNTAAGATTLNANFNSDNANYATDSKSVTITDGQVATAASFNLSQAAIITGYVTSGTGALPNIVIKAVRGVVEYAAPTDATGRFYITASTSTNAYTISPSLDPAQTYSTLPADPLTTTINSPGTTVFAGTITVTGGLGKITGSVTDGSNVITTGVLLLAKIQSGSSISDPPPAIIGSSAPALSQPYYAASSLADGTYSLDVRAGSYEMRAFYPVVNINTGSVGYTSKTKGSVSVTAGQTTSGQNFTWP